MGAALAGLAVAAALLSLRHTSRVGRRLDLVAPAPRERPGRWRAVPEVRLRQAGFAIDPDRFLGVKIASALGAALAVSVAALFIPLGPAVAAVAGYAGFVAPSLIVDHRAAKARAMAEREASVLVERLEALVGAGRPPETALARLVRRPSGAALLDVVLRRTDEAYALGAPLFRTFAAQARADGLATCAAIADDLERARDLGTGSLGVIRERRASLRASERARSLEGAAQVDGKLMLILVLCYLPALLLLVVIPLFIGLLEGLLG